MLSPHKTFILLCLLPACFLSQKIRFISKKSGTTIRVLTRKVTDNPNEGVYNTSVVNAVYGHPGWYFTGMRTRESARTDTFFVGIDSGFYKCNTALTLLMQEHERCMPKTHLADIDRVRNKREILELPDPLPVRGPKDAFINITQISLSVPEKYFMQKNYVSYSDYLKKDLDNANSFEQDLYTEKTIFKDELRPFLVRTGHIDTLHRLNLNIYDKINLDFTIKGITEHKFFPFCQLEIKTLVKFPDYFGAVKEKQYTTLSNIGYDDSGFRDFNNKELVTDALQNLIAQIMRDPQVSNYFKNIENDVSASMADMPIIVMHNKATGPGNLETATDAVVTVVQKGGHGSGCVISNDGYVITNYHVIGADTADVHLIFNSGVKKRARFIRGNPVYDLALLKVDMNVPVPLKINLSQVIKVGSDVYAIGTPNDVSLGQSITKGIISAKRNIENKVYIQSDVSVNSGNSGGALTNKEGELIGIVNAKLVGFGVEGVSFAIPAFYIEEFLKLKVLAE